MSFIGLEHTGFDSMFELIFWGVYRKYKEFQTIKKLKKIDKLLIKNESISEMRGALKWNQKI